MNKPLLYTLVFLIGFGMLMLFSTSISYSNSTFGQCQKITDKQFINLNITQKKCQELQREKSVKDIDFYYQWSGDTYHIIGKQFVYLCLSLLIAGAVFKIRIDALEKLSPLLFLGTLILLVLVFLPVIGIEIKGSHRWINLGFIQFQPSELLKISMILYMANFLVRQEDKIKRGIEGLLAAAFVMFIVAILLLLETDVGAFLIVALTTLAMLFIAHAPLKAFGAIVMSGVVGVVVVILFIPERLARISAFLDPWSDPYGKSYQLIQSLIAIGKGEWLGVGLGGSVQKLHFLPDAHTDFIFAIIGEELGIIGMLLVLFSFIFLIYQTLTISNKSLRQHKKFSAYVAFGIAIWFSLQVFVNLGVNTGILPTKGITLPFFSYGGSSLLISMISMAILLRIDDENKKMSYQKRS